MYINNDIDCLHMWDARLEAIRDRKLNEMIIFSALVRTEPSRRHEFVGIIDKLNMDLDLIEALAENGPVPETAPIENEVYRSRLSKLELMDEFCLDSCRSGENDFGPIICKEHPSTSVTVKQRPESPAVIPDAESPAIIPDSDPPAIIPEAESPAVIPESEPPMVVEKPETPAVIPESKPSAVIPGESEPVADVKEEEQQESSDDAAASQDVASEEEAGIYDLVVSVDDAVGLKRIREMKDGKIDVFIDREMNGHFNDEACENVISFLKTDLKLIDLILSINVTSKEDIESKIRSILKLVEEADEPQNQKMYLNALNDEEKSLEGQYNAILRRLEAVITSRYAFLLDDTESSLFFS